MRRQHSTRSERAKKKMAMRKLTTKNRLTMNDTYHEVCWDCGLCITCGDCASGECEITAKWSGIWGKIIEKTGQFALWPNAPKKEEGE